MHLITPLLVKFLICHCIVEFTGGYIVLSYPFKMGRQNKWKIIMDLDVQDPKDMLTFSSKDLTWTEIYRHDSPLFDRVALIPSHKVSEFVKGEETNANAPCTFLCTVSKPPGRRGSASLRYELYVFHNYFV